jgi:multiple sugar transport system ATP-binding protein
MDEPLSNLDAKLRVQMRSEIGQLQERLGTTTLYVTHDQVEAMTMGDRVAVIRKGRLQQCNTPRALYDGPDNLFVAGFIGSPSMNFVYGRIDGDGDQVRVGFAANVLTIDPSLVKARPALGSFKGKELVVGIRPEAFEVASAVPPAADRTIDAKVDLVEQLGSEAFVHFVLPERPVVTPDIKELLDDQGTDPLSLGNTTKFTARVNPDHAPKTGENAKLVIDTSKLHFFDPGTGGVIR